MRVALAQMLSVHDVLANLQKILGTARDAAASGAGLIVFPEAAMYAFGAHWGTSLNLWLGPSRPPSGGWRGNSA